MNTLELRRQAVHAVGILSILPLLWFGRWIGAAVAGSVLAFFVIWSLWRHGKRRPPNGFETILESFTAKYERYGEKPLMGAVTFYIGATISILVFSEPVAAAAIAVLAIADSASTIVGHYLGRHKLPVNQKKSWEGSVTFWLSAFAVLLFFVSPLRAFETALIAMTIEALPRIDDNISVPLAVGLLLTLMNYFNI